MAQEQQKGPSLKRNRSLVLELLAGANAGIHLAREQPSVLAWPCRSPGARDFWVALHSECFPERACLCANRLNKHTPSLCLALFCQA